MAGRNDRPGSADQYETVNLPSVRPDAPGQQEDRQDAGQGEVNARIAGVPPDPAMPWSLSIRRIWRHTVRLVKSIAARIDPGSFPGSCCG